MNMKLRQFAGVVFTVLIVAIMIFIVKRPEGFVDLNRCGVDLPPCLGKGIRCINGYCKSDTPPTMPLSDLPLTPPRY